jgi:hypothetical protein
MTTGKQERKETIVGSYRRHLHVVNVFLWPSGNAGEVTPRSDAFKGYNVLVWNSAGIMYCNVRAVAMNTLAQVDFVKLGVEAADAEPRQGGLDAVDDGGVLPNEGRALAVWGRLASSSAEVGMAAILQCSRSPRSQPRNARFKPSVSSRSVLAREILDTPAILPSELRGSDAKGLGINPLQSCLSVGGNFNPKAELLDQGRSNLCDIGTILDDENPHVASRRHWWFFRSRGDRLCKLCAREIERDPRALADFALNADRTAGLMCKAIDLG